MPRRLAAIVAALALLVVLPGPAAAKKLSVGETIDVNTASFDDLLRVPGVGKVRARAILEHRANHGPFRSFDDLDKVKGIGKKSLKKLSPWLRVGGSASPQDPPATADEPAKKPRKRAPKARQDPGADTKPAADGAPDPSPAQAPTGAKPSLPKDESKGPNDVEEL